MQLVERGNAQISDPVWMYLGDSWKKKNMSVYKPGSYDDDTGEYETVPCEKTITLKMLLTHTSGLSYGFDARGFMNKVDAIYRKAKLHRADLSTLSGGGDAGGASAGGGGGGGGGGGFIPSPARRTKYGPYNGPLAEFCERLAKQPLLFQPGKHWWYGFNSDVVGR